MNGTNLSWNPVAMILRTAGLLGAAFLLGTLVAEPAGASPRELDYPSPQYVDLFRHVDPVAGHDVQAQFTNISAGGGVQYPASWGIDGGYRHMQINFPSQSSTNSAAMQVTLPAPAHVGSFVQRYAGHRPSEYRILGSDTGFGSLTELVGWKSVGVLDTTITDAVDATVQYVQYEFRGTLQSQYFVMQEFLALPATTDDVSAYAGYNLMALRPGDGGPGPIPTDAAYRAGWSDDPNRIIDTDVTSYLRGNATGGVDPFFILPLNDLYTLYGAAFGPYPDQSWGSGVTIEVTDSETLAGATWTQVHTQSAALNYAVILFDEPAEARFVRVSTTAAGSGGAVCEFQLFALAIPEPATLSLCGLGLVGLLLRRRG
ncbi:MAG: F5/8 type C domain protein [Lentisphaerae bacterium ADurb.BinA184]|nr:MAG: F5/8 type C domain protein [Lentisphaerae bacterium ADurb.BinA184]